MSILCMFSSWLKDESCLHNYSKLNCRVLAQMWARCIFVSCFSCAPIPNLPCMQLNEFTSQCVCSAKYGIWLLSISDLWGTSEKGTILRRPSLLRGSLFTGFTALQWFSKFNKNLHKSKSNTILDTTLETIITGNDKSHTAADENFLCYSCILQCYSTAK